MNNLFKKLKDNHGYCSSNEAIIAVICLLLSIIFALYFRDDIRQMIDRKPKKIIEHKVIKPEHKINQKVIVIE